MAGGGVVEMNQGNGNSQQDNKESALSRRIGALCELALLAPSPEMRGKVIEELARLEGERQERLETE